MYRMIFEFLEHLVALDFGWIFNLIMGNLHWVFAIMAIAFFFTEGKKTISFFLLVIALWWAAMSWANMIGWVLLVGGFLGLFYITRVALLVFAEDVPYLKTKLFVVFFLHFWVLLIVYNLFIV